ncbi:MAG: DUF1207 domain-containing protein [Thiohalophilus sp.]
MLADAVLLVPTYAATGTWLPDYQIYPVNLADPRRPQFSAKILYVDKNTIKDTGNRIYDLKMGGRLGLYHLAPDKSSRLGWLLSLDVGFHGQFDAERSEDNIGWDGIYSLLLSYRPNQKVAFKLGTYHVSAHIGDEYAERTGRVRINYTREELQAGMNLVLTDNLQWYAEAGRAYDQRNKAVQKPWRWQTGLQYWPGTKPTTGWYAGLDIGATEERDWQVDTTLQWGWLIPAGSRQWRVGLEYYDGKVPLGEFFQDDERYISIGLWIDI